jgi:hypothetical protein
VQLLRSFLPARFPEKSSPVNAKFNKVRQILKMKIFNYKFNVIRGILIKHLLEVMPEREEQRKVLPTLKISIGASHSISLNL